MANFRELSKQNWIPADDKIVGSRDQIDTGSFQRMADALELIAKDRQKLIDENTRYQERANRYQQHYENEQRRVAALKGVITKLRKKL